MQFRGTVPASSNLKYSDQTYKRLESRYAKWYGECNRDALSKIAGDEFYVVIPTKNNVENVISSWDNFQSLSYENYESHKIAIRHINRRYGHICQDNIASPEEVSSYIDYTKSPGYPGNSLGISSKAQLVEDNKFLEWWDSFQVDYDNEPLYTVSPKKEYLPIQNVKLKSNGGDEKLRLFTIPPFHLLYEQLRFGKRISNKLKMSGWSKFGFNPYRGGVDRLARGLLSKPIRFYYDISGWDKFLPLMKEVYKFLEGNDDSCTLTGSMRKAYDWMKKHSQEYLVKMYDGSVYLKPYGNASGSGTTTRDNILAHIFIVVAFLNEAYFDKFGCWPEDSLIWEQVIGLYGDDFIGAVDEAFDHVLKPGFLAAFFERYSMKLKFLEGGYDYPLEKMQFLGFNFKMVNGSYLPLFNQQRLATSMVYDGVDSLNREAFICRAFMLYFMSYTSTDHEVFRQAYKTLLGRIRTFEDLTKTEEVFVTLGVLTDTEMLGFYLGLESSQHDEFFDNFLSQQLEEDGFKNFFFENAGKKYAT